MKYFDNKVVMDSWKAVQCRMNLPPFDKDNVDKLIAVIEPGAKPSRARGELMQIELLGMIPISDLAFFILNLALIRYIPVFHYQSDKEFIASAVRKEIDKVIEEIGRRFPELVKNKGAILDEFSTIAAKAGSEILGTKN